MVESSKITYESLGEGAGAPQEVVDEIYEKMRDAKPDNNKRMMQLIEKIRKSIRKYPSSRPLYSYLANSYQMIGNFEKEEEVWNIAYERFPEYLFARIGLANLDIRDDFYEDIPLLLGKDLELDKLYPEKKQFHITEINAYYHFIARLYLNTNQLEKLEKLLFDLQKQLPQEQLTRDVARIYQTTVHQNKLEKLKDLPELTEEEYAPNQTETPPVFKHPELVRRLQFIAKPAGFDDKLLEQIKSLPRNEVIADMEEILVDSIRRLKYYEDTDEGEAPRGVTYAFAVLSELKSKESLESVHEILKQGFNHFEFYFEVDWEDLFAYYVLQVHDQQILDVFSQWFKEPNYAKGKCALFYTLGAMKVAKVITKKQMESWMKNAFIYAFEHRGDTNFFDTVMVTELINYAINYQLKNLLPQIKPFFDEGLINHLLIGDYDEVKNMIIDKSMMVEYTMKNSIHEVLKGG